MSRTGVRRVLGGLGVAAVIAAGGCRTPQPIVRVFTPPAAPPAAPTDLGQLPPVPLTQIEPDYHALPLLDPATADVTGETRPHPVGLTAEFVARRAAEHAPAATALERENEVPTATVEWPGGAHSTPSGGALARELRPLVAADMRNKAAGEAVAAFYQLADAEGRAEVVRKTIESLDKLRAAVKEAKAKGVKPPIDEDELDRQRATWISLLGQVELGAKLLDGQLKRALGASGKMTERFQPAGEFGISAEAVDVPAAVATALERRQDLVAMRTAYLKLAPDNVGEVREFLRTVPGTGGALGVGATTGTGGYGPRVGLFARAASRQIAEVEAAVSGVAAAEVEVRRRQLFGLIEQKERAVADEVRAEAAVLAESVRQVGLARWRAEKLMARLADLRKQDAGAAAVVPAELEANRARADVIQAVMGWHQAKAKLTAAQGLYAGGR